MKKMLKAEDVKPEFNELKQRWDGMLSKYFSDNKVLIVYCANNTTEII